MASNIKRLSAAVALLLLGGAIASASAFAVEAPYWKVEGLRLGEGEHKEISAKVKKEIVLHGEVSGKEVQIKCTSVSASKSEIIGSKERFDGKAGLTLLPKSCSLWVNTGKGFMREEGCEVPAFETTPLSGRLWYEGKKEEHEKIVLVINPEKSEKSTIANVKVNSIKELCKVPAGLYELRGDAGARVSPIDTEVGSVDLIAPLPPITHVWQPQTTEELTLSLEFAGRPATLEFEIEVTLTSGQKFGAYNA
jgi:hypothetical protein